VGKARTRVESLTGFALGLAHEELTVTNTLAYYGKEIIMIVKSFRVQAPI
jgi:hypothetical protein